MSEQLQEQFEQFEKLEYMIEIYGEPRDVFNLENDIVMAGQTCMRNTNGLYHITIDDGVSAAMGCETNYKKRHVFLGLKISVPNLPFFPSSGDDFRMPKALIVQQIGVPLEDKKQGVVKHILQEYLPNLLRSMGYTHLIIESVISDILQDALTRWDEYIANGNGSWCMIL